MKALQILLATIAFSFSGFAMAECPVNVPAQQVVDCVVSEAADEEDATYDEAQVDPTDTAESGSNVKVL